jgi:PAS domain-containing protein
MNDRALEELCKRHDEQAAILETMGGEMAEAGLHRETSAALREVVAEIKRLRLDAGPGRNFFDRAMSNLPVPIFWSLAIGQVVFFSWLILKLFGYTKCH